ncbi:MAG: 2-hydroxyacyl-CoA dehydratase [Desulfobacterium sp.]|nr:2-hydroxyacyl-CoA dehydratase [Desulfobacterium sp.]MBU3947707.1 2-hydroxyacyl-CoA dehydratase family protein [Pseudomonadota bacterium]MBU4009333.1 2-hydroxyacyl-CoA dehydratase family protein [Pseudomonadota bacterium]MBU4035048.1 2-hydroxyacyl-CoA dehydratase family protein [Pseudomonadota bacterium]
MYTNLFKLCGFSDEEIDEQKPRIEKTLKIIGSDTKEMIAKAEKNVQSNFDCSLEGIRMLLKVMMKEVMDAVLSGEEYEKRVYYNWPGLSPLAQAMIVAGRGTNVYACLAKQYLWMGLGNIFDTVNDLLDLGELIGQTAGRAHCPEYQIYTALYERKILPIPTIVLNCGWCCDQGPEVEELCTKLYGYEATYLDGTNDWEWGSWPNMDKRAIEYNASTIKASIARVKETTGLDITDDHIKAALQEIMQITMGYMTLIGMVSKADPQPISQADIGLVFLIKGAGTRYPKDVINGINMLIKETKQKIDAGVGVVPKGAPRVYVQLRTLVDQKPMRAIEELGLAIPMMMVDGYHPYETQPTNYPDDRWMSLSEQAFRKPQLSSAEGSLRYWEWAAKDQKVDGVIMMYPISCRPFCSPTFIGKDYIEKSTGLPTILVEADGYDTRNYSSGQIKTRIESFAEILKANKKLAAGTL